MEHGEGGGPAPLLRMEDVSKEFGGGGLFRRGGWVRAVDRVSITVEPGETLGLVGESGSGKSTVARLALGLLAPSSGRIWLGPREITELSGREVRRLRRQVQMVFQDPYGSLDPRMTVEGLIAEPMAVHRIWRGRRRERVTDLMRMVGLGEHVLGRYPHEFSGGQRQRIGIARAMSLAPSLLVLDEPVSALDVSIQAQIINLLRELQREHHLAYLFIAHDLAVVRYLSHRVAVMYLGRIVETAPRDLLYEAPLHPYTEMLLSAVPVPDPVRERRRQRILPHGEIGSAASLPTGCRFHPRCHRARLMAERMDAKVTAPDGAPIPAVCAGQDPPLSPTSGGRQVACHFPDAPRSSA